MSARAKACLFSAAALIGVAAPGLVHAQELVLHGISAHGSNHRPDLGTRYNERNVGIGMRVQLGPAFDAQAGAYRNSYDRTSAYIVGTWLPLNLGSLHAGAFAGVTNHYPMRDGRVVPVGGLSMRVQGETYSATLRAVPAVAGKTTGVIAIEFGVRL